MKALILVDIQNDFIPGGALAVPEGGAVIRVANELMDDYDFVMATQDFHPADHKSFASQHAGKQVGDVITWQGLTQMLWPDHCVQGTFGAELCDTLDRDKISEIVPKGTDVNIDSYSGFFDNGGQAQTDLESVLRKAHVDEVHIMGLATDYCVKFTALDALRCNFKTKLIERGCRGVELNPGDCQNAIHAMQDAGVEVI